MVTGWMNKPQIILFVGMAHDLYWYNRPCGTYKLASFLRKHGFTVKVIPNCTLLTKQGYQKVIDRWASPNLLWIGFTTSWLAGQQTQDYYEEWQSSTDTLVKKRELRGWYYTDFDNRETVYSCMYTPSIFDQIWSMAKQHSTNCQLLFGGSQLNRNEYFVNDLLHPNAIYIKGNAEIATLEMTKRIAMGNYNSDYLPSNDNYDYGDFKYSFVEFEDDDYIDKDEWLPIEIARGCAFKCKFCNYDMKGVTDNYVNSECLRKNIIEMWERHGTTKFVIMDDLYNDNYDKVQDLYDNCWSQLPFKPELAGYLRLDLLWKRPDQAQLLLDSGFRAGSFGIETLHDKAGKAVGKGLGPKRIIETLEMLKEVWGNRILIHAFFIAGLPHEPMESLENTYEWTRTTDLFHAIIWHWLELENIKRLPRSIDKISIIGLDPKKYGYDFTSDSDWSNNVGVTLDQAKVFNKKANNVKMNTYFVLYGDMRALGCSHDNLMDMSYKVDYMYYINWDNNIKQPATMNRLLRIAGLTE